MAKYSKNRTPLHLKRKIMDNAYAYIFPWRRLLVVKSHCVHSAIVRTCTHYLFTKTVQKTLFYSTVYQRLLEYYAANLNFDLSSFFKKKEFVNRVRNSNANGRSSPKLASDSRMARRSFTIAIAMNHGVYCALVPWLADTRTLLSRGDPIAIRIAWPTPASSDRWTTISWTWLNKLLEVVCKQTCVDTAR